MTGSCISLQAFPSSFARNHFLSPSPKTGGSIELICGIDRGYSGNNLGNRVKGKVDVFRQMDDRVSVLLANALLPRACEKVNQQNWVLPPASIGTGRPQ